MDSGQMVPPSQAKSSRSVLVVDDELFLLEYVRLVLVRDGFTVITATSGEEAWQFLTDARNTIGLILTDIVMPGSFDGFELAARVRRRKIDIPVLFMTGALRDERTDLDAAESDRTFLQKPFGPDELIAIVRARLNIG